jgi:hypothetical protein
MSRFHAGRVRLELVVGLLVAGGLVSIAVSTTAIARGQADVLGFGTGHGVRAATAVACSDGLGALLVGAVLVVRRGQNAVGWVLLAIGLGFTLSNGAELLANDAYAGGRHPSVLGEIALVAFYPIVIPTLASAALLIALFPTGSVVGRWRRPLVRVGAGALALDTLAVCFLTSITPGNVGTYPNPIDGGSGTKAPVGVVLVCSSVLVILAFVAGGDLLLRWRRSREVERQQMKFFGYAVIALVLLLVLVTQLPRLGLDNQEYQDGWTLWFFVALNGFALAVGLAVTRSGLYEIDRLVSRTVSYGLLSGALLGLYAAAVTLATRVLPLSSPVAVAASTLLVAALFNPLRRRVQHVVDRRFNRARFDAELTVAAFSAALRTSIDLQSVHDELLEALRRSVQPSDCAVLVRRGEQLRPMSVALAVAGGSGVAASSSGPRAPAGSGGRGDSDGSASGASGASGAPSAPGGPGASGRR